MKAVLIPVDGPSRFAEVPEQGALAALQELVGGFIEPVGLVPQRGTMYCNEEGKIHGFEVNPMATALGSYFHALDPADFIVGQAVVVGFDPDTGENIEIDADLEKTLRQMGLWPEEVAA